MTGGFPWLSLYGYARFLWLCIVSMVSNGYAWFPMVIHGFLWLSVVIRGKKDVLVIRLHSEITVVRNKCSYVLKLEGLGTRLESTCICMSYSVSHNVQRIRITS